MAKREDFRRRVEQEHRPKYSPLRLILFLIVVGACGIVGYLTLNITMRAGSSGSGVSAIDFGGATSPDQLLVSLYLQVRRADVEARSAGTGSVAFTVQSGDTPATIGARLQSLGLVQDADLFRQVVKARRVETRLEAGDYILQRGMTMDDILIALQHGVVRPNTVRIIEGQRVEEIAALLERQNIVSGAAFIAAAKVGPAYTISALKDRPAGSTLEGFLFPDTYQIPRDATAQQLVSIMLNTFDQKVGSQVWDKGKTQGLTPYQLMIVASIVEREAQQADERSTIASVYINRIKKGMRLEADPTVQYAMGYQAAKGVWWKTPVQLEEYSKVISPYNTYLTGGLPPTPICSPGSDAIRSTFEPANTEFLFFVAKGDGGHAFAKTFEEHQANIARYQK